MSEKHLVEESLCMPKLIVIHQKVSELAALINNHVRFEIGFENYGVTDCDNDEYTEEEWANEHFVKYKPDQTEIELKLYIADTNALHSEHHSLDNVIEELNLYITKAIQKNNRPKKI